MKARRDSVLNSYTEYKEKYNKDHKLYLTRKQFNLIVKRLGEEIAYELITSGEEIILPSRLGTLQIVQYMQRNKKIDFHKTKIVYGEYNKNNPNNKKKVYHTNRITKGYVPKVYWSKAMRANFKNKHRFYFKFTRPNMRINSYNKNNPRVSLISFFKEKGYRIYEIYNPYLKKELHEQLLEKRKNRTTEGRSRKST